MSTRLGVTIGIVVFVAACSGGGGRGGAPAGTAATDAVAGPRAVEDTAAPATAAPVASAAPADGATTTVSTSAPAGTACDESRVAPPEVTGAEPTTVTVWHYLHDRAADELAASVATFEATREDVRVVLVPFASMREELDTWTSTDPADRPDVVLASDDYIGTLAASPDLLPLDGCLAGGGALMPVIEQTYTLGGHLVAAPFLVSTPVLFYDVGAFERAGLDPARPPATLDQLRAALEALVSSGVAPAGIALETGGQSGGSWYVEQWLARQGIESLVAANGRAADAAATSVNWAAPEAVDGIRFLADLVGDGLATIVEDTSGSADLLRMVDTDPAAMAVQSSASIGEVLDVLDQGAFGGVELGVGPLPGPGRGGLVGGAALWLAAGGDPARGAAALDLVRHLTSVEVQAELAAHTGYVPVRVDSLTEPALVAAYTERPQLRVAVDQLRAMPTDEASLVPVSSVRTELRTVLGNAVTAILVGGADAQDALDFATEAAEDLLAGRA